MERKEEDVQRGVEVRRGKAAEPYVAGVWRQGASAPWTLNTLPSKPPTQQPPTLGTARHSTALHCQPCGPPLPLGW